MEKIFAKLSIAEQQDVLQSLLQITNMSDFRDYVDSLYSIYQSNVEKYIREHHQPRSRSGLFLFMVPVHSSLIK